MLKSLTIDNYALIDHTEVEFGNGFSVITGETGAGKSILLGALGMLLGGRADAQSLRCPGKKCVAEAHFCLRGLDLKEVFLQNDLDYDEDDCVLRREISTSGKSRAYVNDSPVTVAVLKAVGERLIDIHSQHQNLLLGNPDYQLDIVDAVASNASSLQSYSQAFSAYQASSRALALAKADAAKAAQELDFLSARFQELDAAKLRPCEQEELEAEQKKLENASDIRESLDKALWLLQDDDNNVCRLLKDASSSLSGVAEVYKPLVSHLQRIDSAMIDLKDVASELDDFRQGVEQDPDRLDKVCRRLDLLYSLQQKYHVLSCSELISLRDDTQEKLGLISNSDEQIASLSSKLEADLQNLKSAADLLHQRRVDKAPELEAELKSLLLSLGMPNARIVVQFAQKSAFGPKGLDEVTFLFSANKDRQMLPIAQTASGGEAARVMLSIKKILSGLVGMPTIIFDEIDTGVSGDIASKMGAIMRQMGNNMQVLSITHLPQIAAKGQQHFQVRKSDQDDGTVSNIFRLSSDERVKALAVMLSGEQITEAAVKNALDLLSAS